MSIFMVDQHTVDAINGIRAAGFYGPVKVQTTNAPAYQIVSAADESVKATVDENGNITYPGANNG